ncbi:hypothetical protein BLNAU_12091 [Blattamonas nauphoetae]|uniref:Uncharacterized protein n=1 Tax=Blattamonas nauphoetae TaxID=2049346 RepID=A0ABQ9XRL8_9EUKA|nr:hypothetical protein BLNAU_12091 [Blattamonas nauphoetae]
MDCSPFLNWREEELESESEQIVVFQSLVTTLKSQPALDVSLEAKILKFLKWAILKNQESADAFLGKLASISDESLGDFTQYIVVLISSPNQAITTAAMEMLDSLIWNCSDKPHLLLVQDGLILQLIVTLNPQSLSLRDCEHIHTCLIRIIASSFWLTTPDGLTQLEIEDGDEEQAVHETVLKQVVVPSAQYICHLCMNRFSIVDLDQSQFFMFLLARLLHISAYYRPTMDFILDMPVVLTIPSYFTFLENDILIWYSLSMMMKSQREWNSTRGEQRQMWKKVDGMLRMEGIEDVLEETCQINNNGLLFPNIVAQTIEWNNLQGMNLP